MQYFGQWMRDSHEGGYGKISLKKAFAVSSNVGISQFIYRCYAKNPDAFVNHLRKFHLHEPLNLQVTGEGMPFIKDTKNKLWSSTSLPWMSIGYEVQLTPLQLLTFYNAVANNGKMVKPKFVDEIREHGKTVKKFDTEVIADSIFSAATLAKARTILEAVVDSGTARNIRNSYYKIAGKTGTAQVGYSTLNKDRKISYQASFTGYFPAENPKYSCIVVIYSPSNALYYGSDVAAPVFKEVADKIYATQFDLHNHAQPLLASSAEKSSIPVKAGKQRQTTQALTKLNIPANVAGSSGWVSSVQSDEIVEMREKDFQNGMVPDVKGMGLTDAIYLLENAGMQVTASGRGVVKKQSLNPGTKTEKGKIIQLELGL
jgi:cell division protein FtsI (penicillin-binding protein 3)